MARVSKSTLIDRSLRNIGKVHPAVKDKVLCIIERTYNEGINVQFSSGYRSNAEQQRLYDKGRKTSGNIVTNAKPGQSVHNYGLAVDYFLTTYDGSKATWTVNKEWRRVAEIAKQLGFQWGGDWKSFPDNPHIDLAVGLSWRELQAGKRPSAERLNKGVTQKGHAGYEVYVMQQKLKDEGYKLAVDGIFGPGTDKALKQFQKDAGLTVDGYYGPNTKKALKDGIQLQEEESDMEKVAIVINSFADFPSVEQLAKRKDAGIFLRDIAEERQVAEQIIVVGGGTKGLKGKDFTDLSGDNRYETAQKVKEYM